MITNEVKMQALVLAVAAVATLAILILFGDMKGPDSIPAPPSSPNYGYVAE